MKRTPPRLSRTKRGSVTIFFILGMICMIGIVGVALDYGHVTARRIMLQNYVDAKALATLKERFDSPPELILARDYLGAHIGDPADAPGGTVMGQGAWDFTAVNKLTSPAPTTLSASQVNALTVTVPNLDVPLFFGPLFGIPSVTIDATAIAFAPKRDVVIVHDVSGSMGSGAGSWRERAATAAQNLVTTMAGQTMPGDRVGVAAFDNNANASDPNWSLPLTTLAGGGAGNVQTWINTQLRTGGVGGGGTAIGNGINAGTNLLTASGPAVPSVERIMVVLCDGDNYSGPDPGTTAANAGSQGIHLYTIFMDSQSNGCPSTSSNNLAALIENRGYDSCTGNPAQITQIMTNIITGVQTRLVQ